MQKAILSSALTLLLPIFVFMQSCGSKSSESATDSTQVASDTIAYTIATLDLKSQSCVSEDSVCAVAHYSYPELAASAPAALRDSMQLVWDKLFGECARGQGPRGCAEAFVRGYDETLAEARQSGMDYTIAWYSNISILPIQWHGAFGLEAVWEEFGGGAHPNTTLVTYYLDPNSGRRLGLADLFADTALLGKRMEEAFYSRYQLQPGKPLAQDSRFFEEATLRLPSVWLPEGDSLTLYWNTYELGPYVSGDFEVKVPVQDLYKPKPAL